jgi:hypothetical protein
MKRAVLRDEQDGQDGQDQFFIRCILDIPVFKILNRDEQDAQDKKR